MGMDFAGWLRMHWVWVVAGVCAGCGLVWRLRVLGADQRRAGRARAELEAYARLDARVPEGGDAREFAKEMCKVVAGVSAFGRVALMTRDEEGRLEVVGSTGTDDVTVKALNAWGLKGMGVGPQLSRGLGMARTGDRGSIGMRSGVRMGVQEPGGVKAWTRSFVLEGVGVWVVPLWSTAGRMLGALVVEGGEAEELGGIESLAAKLARTTENAALAERLLRSEKLAGLGQLAGGVAHALNNPLTAVLGFAELIAETTGDARVQEDATTIVREAVRMRETVQSLLDLWRPVNLMEESVEVGGLVRELAGACEGKLEARGVRLVVEMAEEEAAEVRGNRDRIRLVMEHLLNNAAQAVAQVAPSVETGQQAERHVIRVTVREDERGVQVIVSDTGPGFREPARVFDPFYTTQHVEQGAGLGLSICYGIVREHGGEISAFNLHPRGAAVVVELPLRVVAGQGRG
jgi:signal transduction histidine kinase